jgi:hypothetical protein
VKEFWKGLLRRPRAGVERGRAETRRGLAPGQGALDEPATTGTHRGWGDPQPAPKRESDR